ncbi:MAG: phosphate signaling complex protein PhoU [Christensenellaceae bacterium]|jgi:phosphate transport system protein|nr:phosphate signaling complex protein PhoU [Christensenellaceae bacterium]
MYKNKLDEELSKLHSDLIRLGSMSEDAINLSIKALLECNIEIANNVIENDKVVNKLTAVVESEALKILLRRQPVANDLRVITGALKIVSNIERIADQAQDICSIVLNLSETDYLGKLSKISTMADISKRMVNLSIDSFVKQDLKLAHQVIEMDNDVDELFLQIKNNMVKLIIENSDSADIAIYLMMVAKYFEKIGDHAENIAEWVVFEHTGARKNIRLL